MVSDDFFYADKIRISQVISNLINNSIRFSSDEKEEGKVSIIVKKRQYVKIIAIVWVVVIVAIVIWLL